MGEQLDNESISSPIVCPRVEGVGVSPTAMRVMQVCNATAIVPEEQTGIEGVSNNISGSERLSPLTRSSPASETDAGNVEPKKFPIKRSEMRRPMGERVIHR